MVTVRVSYTNVYQTHIGLILYNKQTTKLYRTMYLQYFLIIIKKRNNNKPAVTVVAAYATKRNQKYLEQYDVYHGYSSKRAPVRFAFIWYLLFSLWYTTHISADWIYFIIPSDESYSKKGSPLKETKQHKTSGWHQVLNRTKQFTGHWRTKDLSKEPRECHCFT